MLSLNLDFAPLFSVVNTWFSALWPVAIAVIAIPVALAVANMVSRTMLGGLSANRFVPPPVAKSASESAPTRSGGRAKRDPLARPFDMTRAQRRLGGREKSISGQAPRRIKRERIVNLDTKPNFSQTIRRQGSKAIETRGEKRRRRSRRRR